MDPLETLEGKGPFPHKNTADALEEGKVLFLPDLPFEIEDSELSLLTPTILQKGAKNISFDPSTKTLKGHDPKVDAPLHQMMDRFSLYAKKQIQALFPHYQASIRMGRTSYRPAEIEGRVSKSYRKDDKRLHVDAFPSTPIKGERILRFFSNINRDGKPRVWNIGEPFPKVAQRFLPETKGPFPFSRHLMQLLGITKGYRTLYDHYMLKIHDAMKKDISYQKQAPKTTLSLPANSSWLVFTDQASHAVLSGQHVLEQTFYLPVEGMQNPSKSPLKILEKALNKPLLSS